LAALAEHSATHADGFSPKWSFDNDTLHQEGNIPLNHAHAFQFDDASTVEIFNLAMQDDRNPAHVQNGADCISACMCFENGKLVVRAASTVHFLLETAATGVTKIHNCFV
jgi:hypothetical protein